MYFNCANGYDSGDLMPKEKSRMTPPKNRIGETIQKNALRRAAELNLDRPRMVEAFEKENLSYKAAQQVVTRIVNGKHGLPQGETRERFLNVFKLKSIEELLLDPEATTKENAAVAVMAGLATAPRATDDEVVGDVRELLADPSMAPYLRMATKILRNLK